MNQAADLNTERADQDENEGIFLWTGEPAGQTKNVAWGELGLVRPRGLRARHFLYLAYLEAPHTLFEVHVDVDRKKNLLISTAANLERLVSLKLVEKRETSTPGDEPIYQAVPLSALDRLALYSPFPLRKSLTPIYEALSEQMTNAELAKRFKITPQAATGRRKLLHKLGLVKGQDPTFGAPIYIQSHLSFRDPTPAEQSARLERVKERAKPTRDAILAVLATPKCAKEIAQATGIHNLKIGPSLELMMDEGVIASGRINNRGRVHYYRTADKIDLNDFATEEPPLTDTQTLLLRQLPATDSVPTAALYRELRARFDEPLYVWHRAMQRLAFLGHITRYSEKGIYRIALTEKGRENTAYQTDPASRGNLATAVLDQLPSNRLKILAVIEMLECPMAAQITLALGDQFYSRAKRHGGISRTLFDLVAEGMIAKTDVTRNARSKFVLTDHGREVLAPFPGRSSLPSIEEMRRRIVVGRNKGTKDLANMLDSDSKPGAIIRILEANGPLTDT